MAHYAIINEQNTVIKVLTGVDETVVQNGVGGTTEAWEQFYAEQLKNPTLTVKRTSYNATNGYRKQYAGIGFTYNNVANVFVAPQPYPSWTLDSNHDWQPPTPKPTGRHRWNEAELVWVAI